jgi:hypothetical protein
VATVIETGQFPLEKVAVVDCYATPISEAMKELLMVFDLEMLNPPMGARSREPDGDVKDWFQGNPVRPILMFHRQAYPTSEWLA